MTRVREHGVFFLSLDRGGIRGPRAQTSTGPEGGGFLRMTAVPPGV